MLAMIIVQVKTYKFIPKYRMPPKSILAYTQINLHRNALGSCAIQTDMAKAIGISRSCFWVIG